MCFLVRQFLLHINPLLLTPFVYCYHLQSASISTPFLSADCSLSGTYHLPFGQASCLSIACLTPIHHAPHEVHLLIVQQQSPKRLPTASGVPTACCCLEVHCDSTCSLIIRGYCHFEKIARPHRTPGQTD